MYKFKINKRKHKEFDIKDDENWNSTWGTVLNLRVTFSFAILIIIGIFIFSYNYPEKIYYVIALGISVALYLWFGLRFRSLVITFIQGYLYFIIYLFFTNWIFIYYILWGLVIWGICALLYKFSKLNRNQIDFVSHCLAGYLFCLFFAEFFTYNIIFCNLLAISWGIMFEIIQYTEWYYFDFFDLRYSVQNSYFDLRNNAIGQLFATIIILLSIYI